MKSTLGKGWGPIPLKKNPKNLSEKGEISSAGLSRILTGILTLVKRAGGTFQVAGREKGERKVPFTPFFLV